MGSRYILQYSSFIYSPRLSLYSFSPSTEGEGFIFPLQGFTWRWFAEFFRDSTAQKSIGNSVIIALSSATISTILAALLTIGLLKGKFRRPELYMTFLMLPVLMPSLTIGISALVFFRTIDFPSGIPVVILAHVSISMSYVFLIMMGRIESFSLSLQEAAIDLGASWYSSIKDIILPNLMPAMVAGWLFAFMLSWNEFIVTYFLIGNSSTLPIYIFSQLRFGISPKVNVISLLVTVFALAMVFIFLSASKLYGRFAKDKNNV